MIKNEIPIDIPYEKIAKYCHKWKVREFSFFGSVLRDDFRPDSDIDVLITFCEEAKYTLFDLIHMENELTNIFGRKVDLVEKKSVEQSENYIRRKHILNSQKVVYVA